jgi:ubiquinone/menaquinone biosynthesis C-methylase UbiE
MTDKKLFKKLVSYVDFGLTDSQSANDKPGLIYDNINKDGYLDLLNPSTSKDTLAQKLMKWNPIVSIYESRLWRNSRWMGKLFGISLKDEMKMIKRIHSLHPSSNVVDLACGTGFYTRMFAKRVHEGFSIGIDFSPQMLFRSVKLANREKLTNIGFIRADAHRIPLKDNCVNSVHCSGALHLFHDVISVLSEIKRILLPKSKVTIACGKKRNVDKLSYGESVLGATLFNPNLIKELLTDSGFYPEIHFEGKNWVIASGVLRS